MKTLKIVSGVFASIGTTMLLIALYLFVQAKNFEKIARIADGVVIDVTSYESTDSDGHSTTMYQPVVKFVTYLGDTVVFTTNHASSSMRYMENEEVEVLYNPDNPKKAKINSFEDKYIAVLILGIMGTIFGGIGWIMVGYRIHKNQQKNYLLKNGKRIDTNFVEVMVNYSIKANGRSPYQIITHYKRDNEIFEFKSENIWFNPSDYVDFPVISVLVDPKNYKKYYMDISFLPKMNR